MEESLSNPGRYKERQCYSIFYDVNMSTKGEPTVNFLAFPSVKFRKIWQTSKKYFTLVRARFLGTSI